MVKYKYDGGYGTIGNMVHYVFLHELTGEDEKKYRSNLKKDNPTAYKEYLEYEKRVNKK